MQAKIYKRHAAKLARSVDLERIHSILVSAEYLAKLKRKDRIVAAFFVALAKIGFCGISTPADAIGGALRRLNQGISRSTLFRRLAELEAAGLIRRQTFKAGENRLQMIVHFEPALLSYISTQVSKRPSLDLTSNRSLCNPTELFKSNQARARVVRSVSDCENQKWWDQMDPILKTLHCTATGKKRPQVLTRAEMELTRPELRQSGIDWPAWIQKWPEMTVDERKHAARTVLIPELEAERPAEHLAERPERPGARGGAPRAPRAPGGDPGAPRAPGGALEPAELEILEAETERLAELEPEPTPQQMAADLKELISALCDGKAEQDPPDWPRQLRGAPRAPRAPGGALEAEHLAELDAAELEILEAARARARARSA